MPQLPNKQGVSVTFHWSRCRYKIYKAVGLQHMTWTGPTTTVTQFTVVVGNVHVICCNPISGCRPEHGCCCCLRYLGPVAKLGQICVCKVGALAKQTDDICMEEPKSCHLWQQVTRPIRITAKVQRCRCAMHPDTAAGVCSHQSVQLAVSSRD